MCRYIFFWRCGLKKNWWTFYSKEYTCFRTTIWWIVSFFPLHSRTKSPRHMVWVASGNMGANVLTEAHVCNTNMYLYMTSIDMKQAPNKTQITIIAPLLPFGLLKCSWFSLISISTAKMQVVCNVHFIHLTPATNQDASSVQCALYPLDTCKETIDWS